MNLYQIDSALAECVDAETGEILDVEKLLELNMEREQKIENIALWIKNDVSEAKAIREEEKSLAARRQALERAAESKKKYLDSVLNGEKFSTPRCSISYRKSVAQYVQFYNELRPHRTLKYKTPQAFEEAYWASLS